MSAGMPEGRGPAVPRSRTITKAAAATATATTTPITAYVRTRGGRLAGPYAGWPGSFATPPSAACWPAVALLVIAMLFLAQPVGTARSHPEHNGMRRWVLRTDPAWVSRARGG